MQAMHRALEGELGAKKHAYYVADGVKCLKLTETKLVKWITNLEKEEVLRVTQAHSTDVVLLGLAERGVKIQYAHWHSTGLEKNLPPEAIATGFYNLPQDIFRDFKPRADLAQLRHLVDARLALMEHRKADFLRLGALKRSIGLADEDSLPKQLQIVEDELLADKRKFETPVDKKLSEVAESIPECVAFNAASGVADSWVTSGTVVAFLGDISRFPMVSSLWHYCGQHVVEGLAPKRKRGEPGTWHPRVRTALWLLGTSIIKNRNNRWRPVYEQFLDKELQEHDVKHPGCKTKQGHCGARARRRVVKEILKEFYLTVCGETEDVLKPI